MLNYKEAMKQIRKITRNKELTDFEKYLEIHGVILETARKANVKEK